MSKDYEIQSVKLLIAKAIDNRHKKPQAHARAKPLKANAKTITIRLSCKKPGISGAVMIVEATVETDNLLVARIEAAKAARGFGFSNADMIELDYKKHRC